MFSYWENDNYFHPGVHYQFIYYSGFFLFQDRLNVTVRRQTNVYRTDTEYVNELKRNF